MKRIFTEDHIQYIVSNYATMPYSEIAKNLGYSERQVRGKINGMGLSKLRKFDKCFFSKIDSPNKAYWLGFIYADGWVRYDSVLRNYELGIELQERDSYILDKLNSDLGEVHNVILKKRRKEFNGYTFDTNSAVLRIYCKQIVRDLISHGVVERKTESEVYPICNSFFSSFLRGYLDGDGCIYTNRRKGIDHCNVIFTCSNPEFLSYINSETQGQIGLLGRIYKEKDKKYRLMFFRDAEVRELLDWIYRDKNVPMLTRKYGKYISYYGLAA